MKKFLATALTLCISSFASASPTVRAMKSTLPATPASSDARIVLTSDNLVLLRGEVSGATVSKAIEQIETSKSNDLYLYLSTPGGSVFDGLRLTDAILNSPKRITCIVDVAASMGFVITQACDYRVVTSSSILMQHEASWGVKPQPEPHALSFVEFLRSSTEEMKRFEAARLGISYEDYRAKTRNDLWLFGAQAVKANAADAVKGVTCEPKLFAETEEESFRVMIFQITVIWSKCPIISEPRSVSVLPLKGLLMTPATNAMAEKILTYLDRNYLYLRENMSSNAAARKSDSNPDGTTIFTTDFSK